MSRYIDADALLIHLADYQLQESPTWGANGYGNKDKYEAITDCIKAVEEQPSAQPERKTGEWLHKDLDNFRKYEVICSVCGARFIGNYDAYDEPYDFNFCPNCGADMREIKGATF